jgi:hypothetical protein
MSAEPGYFITPWRDWDRETGNPLVEDAVCGAGLSGAQRARIIWPSFSPNCRLYEPEAWRPRVFLRQAQDRLPLRRTGQVRLGFDFGFRISDLGFFITIDVTELNSSNFAIRSLVLTSFFVDSQSAFHIPNSAIVDPVTHPSPRSRDDNS